MNAEFPAVKVRLNEDLESAYQRVLQAFAEQGIKTIEVPLPPVVSTAVRLFFVLRDSVNHAFIVATRALTDEEEDAFLNVAIVLIRKLNGEELYFRGFSPVMFPETMRYVLKDAVRFRFVVLCNDMLNEIPKPTPEQASKLGILASTLCTVFGRPSKPVESLSEIVDHVVLNVLRTEKNPDLEDSGYQPNAALMVLGYLLGESIRFKIEKIDSATAEWIEMDGSLWLDISLKVKKGFFSSTETKRIGVLNPVGKVFKLFRNGQSDSALGLEGTAVAETNYALENR